jgi:hypothetical protein
VVISSADLQSFQGFSFRYSGKFPLVLMDKIDDPLGVVAGVLSEGPANGFAQEEFLVVHVG